MHVAETRTLEVLETRLGFLKKCCEELMREGFIMENPSIQQSINTAKEKLEFAEKGITSLKREFE